MKAKSLGVILAVLMITVSAAGCGSDNTGNEPQETQSAETRADENTDANGQESIPDGSAQEGSQNEDAPEADVKNEEKAEPEDSAALAEMYTAYLQTLQAEKKEIFNYDWQLDRTDDDDLDRESNRKRIALKDLYGDDKPELLYISAPDGGYGYSYEAFLHICTWEEDGVKEIYNDRIDVAAGGGMYFVLFTREGSPDLFDIEDYGDENWTWVYGDYSADGDKITKTDILKKVSGPDENDYEKTVEEFYSYDETVTPEEYSEKESEIKSSVKEIIMYSGTWDEEFRSLISEKGATGWTYEEALDALIGLGAETAPEEAGDPEDAGKEAGSGDESGEVSFEDIAGNYAFASGVGGWYTEMQVMDDGTFTGYYHDSDMGDADTDYDATVYECEFSGRFDGLVKEDELTYTMELAELAIENPPGETYIDEDRLRHIYSTPYGISESGEAYGQEFKVYLAGSETEGLPEEYNSWAFLTRLGEVPEVADNKGIYNVDEQLGWYSAD